ncbi:MutS-related protein [Flavobacterium franklandianum]|uniref:DNA mismatch repair protein n=1 Tax=Flavobacterium franklandianum TaxID=2594430 RepID=A0A553C7C6_9FLAO|nr:DNA mismatch repair protein [Flavobacterium franklandianum]TRX16343.1 DNA mismatch repair protein [Flavobacterium franklandianum]
MEPYQSRILTYSQELTKTKTQYNTISLLRLASILLFLILGYYYIKESNMLLLVLAISFLVAFFLLMRWHSKLLFQIKMMEALRSINSNEKDYLENNQLPFENGEEFIDFQHPYGYDLDIFGNHSLFQNYNRTATYIGKKTLAHQCVHLLSNEEIMRNQQAIMELADKLDWRQEFLALAKISQDTKQAYETVLKWSTHNSTPLSKVSVGISIISPFLFLGFALSYWITSNVIYLNFLSFVFVFNLGFLGRYMKRMQVEIAHSSNIDTIISDYGLLLQKIENEDFKADKLIHLQKQLTYQKEKASVHLKQLASLFSSMDTIQNLITGVIFNGTFLFNLQIFKALIVWKNQHAAVLENWLVVIGEFEMLNSLANVSYNNPDFVFPVLNDHYEISFSNLSHPLLAKKSRVGNDIDFQPQSFMILTGSNMSGKSTFLRSLGINMVLTGMGAAVCATKAKVHPIPVLVSMRLADSLSDSESYFFAEIKRLKQIMDELDHQPAFVLLDEILRGTNSDDKRNGTIEVIKKVIANKAIGAIATHDIEVCLTTNEFPDILINKCFEVEIRNNDLHFDFVLRDGICKNKSATFLMRKMGVI